MHTGYLTDCAAVPISQMISLVLIKEHMDASLINQLCFPGISTVPDNFLDGGVLHYLVATNYIYIYFPFMSVLQQENPCYRLSKY